MGTPGAVIRRGRKFDQVVQGAREVFLRDGFSGASVDDIARVAGVSKATLYAYFPDKRQMFEEMARAECLRQAEEAEAQIDMARPVRDVLHDAALRFVTFVTSDVSLRIFRICVAEADRFPELGRAFYDSGPMLARTRLSAFFAEAQARGELRITDLDMAAEQFSALCKAMVFDRVVFGVCQTPNAAECHRVAEAAVATFMARYGAEPPG